MPRTRAKGKRERGPVNANIGALLPLGYRVVQSLGVIAVLNWLCPDWSAMDNLLI
ncbi:hypothetical protein ACVIGB_000927 [Bradyrhizobium sp. USDA 4341]